MDSLVGYGSDDENESERYGGHIASVGGAGRRRDDDTNYDDVNMDMSEDSQEAESEPELPPAEPAPPSRHSHDQRRGSDDSRERSRDRNRSRESDRDRKDRRRESPARRDRDRRSPKRDDRYGRSDIVRDRKDGRLDRGDARSDRGDGRSDRGDSRSDRGDSRPDRGDSRPDRGDRRDRRSPKHRSDRNDRGRGYDGGSGRRGLLGDRPDDRSADGKVPALMDLKPFGGEPPPAERDTRDAVSPRFVDRDRRDRDRGDRERDRDRHSRRSEEGRPQRRAGEQRSRSRSRSRSRGAAYPPPAPAASSSGERRGSPPSGDYRPSSYKVNKKLEVMEKMGLQIKTPDGSMATAQQLRAAAGDAPTRRLPQYYNPGAVNAAKILDQVAKRKLLWANKPKQEAEAPGAAAWSGARFAQDSDGRQANKFLRLMGIRDPAAVKAEAPASGDGMKKQEELFQAMQAQYDVARATTHTMRGVGLGFSRNQY